MCAEEDSANYRSIIGCCIWINVLGTFDIAYATSAITGFNFLPRKGHLKAAKGILSFLKIFPMERIIVDTTHPNHSNYPTEDHPNLKDFYPDAE
jgi:hypothetical protein